MNSTAAARYTPLSKTAIDVDAVVVGAGFTGIYMLYRLRQGGFTARCFDSASGVGGTWYGIDIRVLAAILKVRSTPSVFRGVTARVALERTLRFATRDSRLYRARS